MGFFGELLEALFQEPTNPPRSAIDSGHRRNGCRGFQADSPGSTRCVCGADVTDHGEVYRERLRRDRDLSG